MLDQAQFSEGSIEGIPKLRDKELLKATADLVHRERQVLTLVLHHLREVEKRRLFSDLGYPSLFEDCVRELKYSEGQAGRRIQAMRLLKELPEIESMIKSGSLSLTNLSQAQSYFRDVQKQAIKVDSNDQGILQDQPLSRALKLEILQSLENTSSREGQKRLIEIEQEYGRLGAAPAMPKDRERPLAQDYNQVCFAMSPELKEQLEIARSLLGAVGAQMNLNDLILKVPQIAVRELEVKKFGKKRNPTPAPELDTESLLGMGLPELPSHRLELGLTQSKAQSIIETKPTENLTAKDSRLATNSNLNQSRIKSSNPRHIPRANRRAVWDRDGGKCVCCSSRRNLNFDHIQPVALGGESDESNLRLLCFQCNQRQAIKTFGVH